jgi:hypothetical protein
MYLSGALSEKPKSWRAGGTRVIGMGLTRSSLVTLAHSDLTSCARAMLISEIVTAPTIAIKKPV